MKTQPWNAQKVVSRKIGEDDWKQLLAVCPQNKEYILKALRFSGNRPVRKTDLLALRVGDHGTSTHHDLYRDIQGLNNCFRIRGLSFSVRVTEGIYSQNPKVQLCKIKPNRPKRVEGVVSFSQAMGRVKQEILSHPNPTAYFISSVLPRLCP